MKPYRNNVLVQAALTTPQTEWLKQQTFISTVLEVERFKIKTLTDPVSGENPLYGLEMSPAHHVLCDEIG